MSTFSLDSIRESAEQKYGSTKIEFGEGEVVELTNPLRLSKEDRQTLSKIQERMEEEGSDEGEVMAEAILLVAAKRPPAQKLLSLVGDDLGVLASIFEKYTGDSQVGEASASQN